jgi:DNA invertase Pin-like site-specific DNA recombinase
MKTVAYVRVSTDAQDMTHQRLAILEFARRERMVVDEVLEIQASARRPGPVRHLDTLLSMLQPGDVLIVSELSRLGRCLVNSIFMGRGAPGGMRVPSARLSPSSIAS